MAARSVEPTWEYISEKVSDFKKDFGGIYTYVAAAIEHDHRSLKPVEEYPGSAPDKN